jgi:hypothetical protein
MGGNLLVAPLIMAAAAHWPFDRVPGRAGEAIVQAAAVVGLSVFVFRQETNLAYLAFPLLVWAALRFWQPGAAAASLAVATIAVYYTANAEGPFVRSNPDDSLLLAQTYIGVTGVTVLLLAAVITERRRAEETVEQIAEALQESLLPSRLPEIAGIELAARFRPVGTGHRVGGDFYDVFESGDGSWSVAVGDVCGKGPKAAAVTGSMPSGWSPVTPIRAAAAQRRRTTRRPPSSRCPPARPAARASRPTPKTSRPLRRCRLAAQAQSSRKSRRAP